MVMIKPLRRMELASANGPEALALTETAASTAQDTVEPDDPGNNSGQSPVHPSWNKLLHITDDNYKSVFQQHKDVFIMFHAKWCGHCSVIKPIFVELALSLDTANPPAENTPSNSSVATLAACDTDTAPSLVDEFELIVLPTFKYVRNGEAIREYGGERTKEGFKEFLKKMSEEN